MRYRLIFQLLSLPFGATLAQSNNCATEGNKAKDCGFKGNNAPQSCCASLVCSSSKTCVQDTTGPGPSPTPAPPSCPDPCVQVDVATRYQSFYGVGASMTESSAYILENAQLSLKEQMLSALFDPAVGIGLNILRQPMGTSDFRVNFDYTYEDTSGSFNISPDATYVLPAVKSCLAANSKIKVMGVPWSYPAWMKDNGLLNGGSLSSNVNYADVGKYFSDYVTAYKNENIDIWAVSVQNEPLHGSSDYPTMIMTTQQHADAATAIRTALDATNFHVVKLVAYDHNWDRPDYPIAVLGDNLANSAIDAIAFHCYGGSVDAQTQVKDAYPSKEIFFTECTESGSLFYEGDFRWAMKNLVMGALKNHASTLLEWNLILDSSSGPKIFGGCSNCRGLLNLRADNSGFTRSPAYFAFGHLSKFVQYGATRVDSTSPSSSIHTLSLENPNGSGLLIMHNDRRSSKTLNVKGFGVLCTGVQLQGYSAMTLFFDGTTLVQKWVTNFRNGNDPETSFLQDKGSLGCSLSR